MFFSGLSESSRTTQNKPVEVSWRELCVARLVSFPSPELLPLVQSWFLADKYRPQLGEGRGCPEAILVLPWPGGMADSAVASLGLLLLRGHGQEGSPPPKALPWTELSFPESRRVPALEQQEVSPIPPPKVFLQQMEEMPQLVSVPVWQGDI